MSSRRSYSSNVVCPYYQGNTNHAVYCEGFVDNSSMRLAFPLPELRRVWMQEHCNQKGYVCDCWIAQLAERKWRERE